MKSKSLLNMQVIALLGIAALLLNACQRKTSRTTKGTIYLLGDTYSALLKEGVYPDKEGVYPDIDSNFNMYAFFSGNNPKHRKYLDLPKNYLNVSGCVVDVWGHELQVIRPDKNSYRILIRSAGNDGVLNTGDDICVWFDPSP